MTTNSNLEKYKRDLRKLIETGVNLLNAIQYECHPKEVRAEYERLLKGEKVDKGVIEKILKELPSFKETYQSWYSEAKAIIKQILPDRFSDFTALYEKPKSRKTLDHGTYVIADYLQGLGRSDGSVGPSSAIPQFNQQLNILKSANARFESSLFDIKQLVQADLLDSELEAARELSKNKFSRAAGAVAGVVLEKHLRQVHENHDLKITKKNPSINDLNQSLKDADIIEMPTWRFIQHLGDLRNLCDHNKDKEPSDEQVSDLIDGVDKIAKTVF